MAGNSSNSSTSTSSAAGAAGAGVGAGVGSTSTGSQTTSTTGPSTTSTSGKGSSGGNGSGSSGLTFTGLTFSDGKFSAPSGKGTTGNSTSTKGVTLGSVGTGLGLDGSIGEGIGLTTQSSTPSSTKAEPVMTVDEVYGKGNQSIVENQGDYEAASNEKSNVETQTFGKQDEISFTPESITENKGEVENDAIQSVEGLDFQQKDKVAQEVMDAKKARDEAEAEDKSDKAREQLAANEEEENAFDFKVGESEAEKAYNDEDAAWQQNLQEQKAQIDAYKESIEDTKAEIDHYESRIAAGRTGMKSDLEIAKTELAYDTKTLEALQASYDEMEQQYNSWKDDSKSKVENGEMVEALAAKAKEKANKAFEIAQKEKEYAVTKTYDDGAKAMLQEGVLDAVETMKTAPLDSDEYNNAIQTLKAINDDYIGVFRGDRNAYKNPGKMLETINNVYDDQTARFQKAYEAIANSKESEETKAKAIETVNNVEANAKSVEEAANALAANINDPAAVEAYVNAVKAYNENLENALNDKDIGKTDFNKAFTEMVAKANDFDVTLPDGTKKGFAEFAAEMAVRSPEIAKGLYEAKARNYEENGHKVLAAIENAKSKMVMTWLGSKFTFADNQVRSQFVQMAKTDMRATYATYNNVLNDPNATAEAKADAEAQISQANALMTASAALQASTGFFSGIGDSMSDGVYGVTDPNALNVSQKTMNAISNFAKVVLGLGVTPGANKAYQNMYYLAADKVNKSNLFGKDFDGDGFALCQEYGNNAAAGMIAGVGELATGIALFFNPATASMGLNLAMDSIGTFLDGLYGVQREAQKSVKYSSEIIGYLNEAKDIAEEAGTEKEKTVSTTGVTIDRIIDSAISQIESFELKSDEANNLDNWLEGSGSNTTGNEKFNQSLTYDEWLKLIEADPAMQEYAKKLIAEKR